MLRSSGIIKLLISSAHGKQPRADFLCLFSFRRFPAFSLCHWHTLNKRPPKPPKLPHGHERGDACYQNGHLSGCPFVGQLSGGLLFAAGRRAAQQSARRVFPHGVRQRHCLAQCADLVRAGTFISCPNPVQDTDCLRRGGRCLWAAGGCGALSPPCAGMLRSTFCWPGFALPLSCAQAHRCCKRQILRYTCAFRRSCCCCFLQPAAARCGWYCTFRAARRRPPGRLGSSLNCAVPPCGCAPHWILGAT